MIQFALDDIHFWHRAFAEFGIDIEPLLGDSYRAQGDGLSLANLDGRLEEELQRDANHKFHEWIVRDRAYEAFGLIESDGPNHAVDGRLTPYSYGNTSMGGEQEAFINLIKSNIDRVVSQLEASNVTVSAYANDERDQQAVQALNDLKANILDDNNFPADYLAYVRDGVSFGRGYMKVCYEEWKDNPDQAMMLNRLQSGQPLTQQDMAIMRKAFKNHRIEYVNTFEMIPCRMAKGQKDKQLTSEGHRWLHRIRQVSVSQARSMFPEYATAIQPNSSKIYSDTNPSAYYRKDLQDTVALKESWIRFHVNGTVSIPWEQSAGMINVEQLDVSRYAIAKVTRIEGLGIVDLDIDEYNHHRYPFASWTYSDSFRHANGIGIVKYGRDPLIVHNKLHNGMLKYFGTSIKGGGLIDARLGISKSDMQAQTKPGTWKKVEIPEQLQGEPLSNFIVENRPPTFPSVYADLMAIESKAIDEAMNVPNVYKGIKSGTSGLQEQILQQQADMAHSAAGSALKQSMHNFGVLLFSNIQQYEKEPFVFFVNDRMTGERRQVEVNMPKGWYLQYNPNYDDYEAIPDYVENDITNLMFKVRLDTQSIVPEKPAEKAAFIQQFFNQTQGMVVDPLSREWLRGMLKFGFNVPGIAETLDSIDEREQQMMQSQQQQQQQQQQMELAEKQDESAQEWAEIENEKEKIQNDYITKIRKLNQERMLKLKELNHRKSAHSHDAH